MVYLVLIRGRICLSRNVFWDFIMFSIQNNCTRVKISKTHFITPLPHIKYYLLKKRSSDSSSRARLVNGPGPNGGHKLPNAAAAGLPGASPAQTSQPNKNLFRVDSNQQVASINNQTSQQQNNQQAHQHPQTNGHQHGVSGTVAGTTSSHGGGATSSGAPSGPAAPSPGAGSNIQNQSAVPSHGQTSHGPHSGGPTTTTGAISGGTSAIDGTQGSTTGAPTPVPGTAPTTKSTVAGGSNVHDAEYDQMNGGEFELGWGTGSDGGGTEEGGAEVEVERSPCSRYCRYKGEPRGGPGVFDVSFLGRGSSF